jgi:hypothetical protein
MACSLFGAELKRFALTAFGRKHPFQQNAVDLRKLVKALTSQPARAFKGLKSELNKEMAE